MSAQEAIHDVRYPIDLLVWLEMTLPPLEIMSAAIPSLFMSSLCRKTHSSPGHGGGSCTETPVSDNHVERAARASAGQAKEEHTAWQASEP